MSTDARPAAPRAAAPDLAVRIGPLALRNPILTASGTFGYGDEYAHVVELRRLGAVVTKTVTVQPRPGNPPGRIIGPRRPLSARRCHRPIICPKK